MATEERQLRLNWPPRNDGTRGPSARQVEFFECGAKEQLYGGSKRGGKTVAGCAKAIYLSYMFPGNRGLIARQAFTDLRDSTLVTFFLLCPEELIKDHNRSEHRIQLYTCEKGITSTIIYRGLGEESTAVVPAGQRTSAQRAKEKSKAIETGWFWIDEPSEVAFDAYRMMLSQLNWFLRDGTRPPYMALLTSNPEPGWVKDRFIDEEHPDYMFCNPDVDARFIPSLPRDNPGLPPGWEQDLRDTMDEDWIRRYLDGNWDIHEGMVFTELDERIHNLDRYVDDDNWHDFCKALRKVGGLDHGSTGITAYVMTGLDWDENLFALEEHYKANLRISEHAAGIHGLEDRYGKPEYRVIDPSTESATLQNKKEMYSVQQAYADPRFGHVQPGREIHTIAARRSSISVGIDLLKEYIHVNPFHRLPFTNELASPRLFISKKRCPNLWREMIALKKELKPDGSIVFKGTDHGIDDIRYIAMSRPPAAERKKKDVAKLPTMERIKIRTHDKWAATWGKTQETGTWFGRL